MEKALEIFYETVRFSQQVQETYTDAEKDLVEYQRTIENSNSMVEKALRAQKKLEDISCSLDEEQRSLTEEVAKLYQSLAPKVEGLSDHNSAVQEVEQEKRVLSELQSNLVEARDRQKEIEFARKELKLQQATLPLQIDTNSTREAVKGFIRRPSGQIEIVEFDLTKGDSVSVADEAWGHAKDRTQHS